MGECVCACGVTEVRVKKEDMSEGVIIYKVKDSELGSNWDYNISKKSHARAMAYRLPVPQAFTWNIDDWMSNAVQGTNLGEIWIKLPKCSVEYMHFKMSSQTYTILFRPQYADSLRPSDAICWHQTGSTLARVMAYGLLPDGTKPLPEVLNPWSLIVSEVHNYHMGPISHQIPQPSIILSSLEITNLKFHLNLPGINELMLSPEWSPGVISANTVNVI